MKLVPLSTLFRVKYGVNLELNKMVVASDGVPFVGRSDRNNGVTARVAPIPGIEPLPGGTLTVAGGGSVLATFLQPEPYYSGRDLFYLQPLVAMSDAQKLYYAECIRANRYRYNYGRQANRTLADLLLPSLDSLPSWLEKSDVGMFDGADLPSERGKTTLDLYEREWKLYLLSDLFVMKKGKRLTKSNRIKRGGDIPFIGAVDSNNGVSGNVDAAIHKEGTLTVNYNGAGVAEAFYQPVPFWASDDVNVLYPKFEMSPEIALFIATVIRKEKYRFSYGRKWHLSRMEKSEIHLPADILGNPDWRFMEQYIRLLPFSSVVNS
jgi:hypothetical protein